MQNFESLLRLDFQKASCSSTHQQQQHQQHQHLLHSTVLPQHGRQQQLRQARHGLGQLGALQPRAAAARRQLLDQPLRRLRRELAREAQRPRRRRAHRWRQDHPARDREGHRHRAPQHDHGHLGSHRRRAAAAAGAAAAAAGAAAAAAAARAAAAGAAAVRRAGDAWLRGLHTQSCCLC